MQATIVFIALVLLLGAVQARLKGKDPYEKSSILVRCMLDELRPPLSQVELCCIFILAVCCVFGFLRSL